MINDPHDGLRHLAEANILDKYAAEVVAEMHRLERDEKVRCVAGILYRGLDNAAALATAGVSQPTSWWHRRIHDLMTDVLVNAFDIPSHEARQITDDTIEAHAPPHLPF